MVSDAYLGEIAGADLSPDLATQKVRHPPCHIPLLPLCSPALRPCLDVGLFLVAFWESSFRFLFQDRWADSLQVIPLLKTAAHSRLTAILGDTPSVDTHLGRRYPDMAGENASRRCRKDGGRAAIRDRRKRRQGCQRQEYSGSQLAEVEKGLCEVGQSSLPSPSAISNLSFVVDLIHGRNRC